MKSTTEISLREKDAHLAGGDAIRVHNLEKRFGDFVAVNRVSFQVRRGEIFGFLGANGSGKSTTIRMLCGILPPTAGEGGGDFDISGAEDQRRHRLHVPKILPL